MDKKIYRNALRSKKMMQDAYLALVMKKDISKIRAQEVIETAQISKGTFYAHYTCLQDLQQELEDEHLTHMFSDLIEKSPELLLDDFYPLFKCGLKEMAQDRALFIKFMSASYGDSFINKLKQKFIRNMLSGCAICAHFDTPYSAKFYFTYVAGGTIALIQEWLQDPTSPSPEVMARFLSNCAVSGIAGLKASESKRTDDLRVSYAPEPK